MRAGYTLTFGLVLVPSGKLGDALGRKRTFLIGLFLFTGVSLMCALAPTAGWLVFARLLQGVAGGLLNPQIIAMIMRLIERGHAYAAANGDVMYSVSSFPGYGQLSGKKLGDLRAGARVDVDEAKRDPLDFVLWQRSLPDEPAWDTLWGPGRPGWHIECSALALRELGTTIDLHGGGTDLIFPHHECERAQSEAATGDPFVRHWMHTGLIAKDGEKMSKSLGNLVFVDELRKEWDPMAVRLGIIEHHYRTEWTWTDADLALAGPRWGAWRAAAARSQEGAAATEMDERTVRALRERLADDLDAPGARRAVDAWAADVAGRGPGGVPTLVPDAVDALLGLDLRG